MDYNTLETVVTIEDPGTYQKPFRVKSTSRLAEPSEELMEYICQENNPDPEHLRGPAHLGESLFQN